MSAAGSRRVHSSRGRRTHPSQAVEGKKPSGSVTRLPSIRNSAPRGGRSRSSISEAGKQRRVQRDAELILAECLWHLCGENAEETMNNVLAVVNMRRSGALEPRKGLPLWQRVQAIVVVANQEGVRRIQMAIPCEKVLFFFDSSLRLLELPSKISCPWRQDEFASLPSLRKYLVGATLNNKAFLQKVAGDPAHVVVQTLLHSLKEQRAAFSTMTLYNLAVVMVAVQRFELASHFIACCSELIEVCLRIDISGCKEVQPLYNAYIVNIAKHAITCHHLVAALAAWCRMRDVEMYHCQLAVCCAQRFIDPKSLLAIRCKQRLLAARDGSSALMMSENEPPRLPMLTDDLSLVSDPLFIVLLERVEKIQVPSRLENYMSQLMSRRGPLASCKLGLLPPIKRGRQRSSGTRRVPTPGRKRTPTSRERLPMPRRVMSSTSRRSQPKSGEKSEISISTTAVMESFKKERAATPPRDEAVFSMSPSSRPGSPALITLVPKTAFYCYKHLRKELRQLMRELGDHVSYEATATTNLTEGRESLGGISIHESIISESKVVSPNPKTYMQIMDRKLRFLSRVFPDEEFERKKLAIVIIQSFWRGAVDRRECRRLQSMVHETTIRREAAEIIQRAFRNHCATRECIRKKKELRAHRIVVQRVTLIQRYLYQKNSVEKTGGKKVMFIKRAIAEILEARRRNAAAIRLQSFWRMCTVWMWLRRVVAATRKIQCVLRGHRGRVRARERRVYVRLEEQKRIARHTMAARPIQAWWRNVLLLRACKAILTRRQRDVMLYLEEIEEKFNVEWERIKHLPNVELCILKILAVLRGFHCRVEIAWQRKRMHILRRFFLCILWKKREQRRLKCLREERQGFRMLRRRREEVLDAVLRIQCAARRWLASRVRSVLWAELQSKHHQARVIQRTYRRHVGRRWIRALKEEARLEEEKRMVGQIIHYSASKIQATWRMYIERRSQAEYLRFLLWERHILSSRIQRAWRAHKARLQSHWRRLHEEDTHRHFQERQYRLMAVIRIQSVVRMFLARQKLLHAGVRLRPTPAFLNWCAQRIQCAWRRYAAYEYVQQLRFSRSYYDQQKINMESLYTYATMIQSLVRAKILNVRRVAARLLEVENDDEDHKRKREAAMRSYYAAITTQQKGRLLEDFLRPQPATPTSSVTTEGVASSPADAGPEDSQEDGERLAEELVQLVQRCGRGALARRSMFSVLSDTPRWKAAVDIQRVWRGYCSRQLVEVYYEFPAEEVRTEGDRSEKGGNMENVEEFVNSQPAIPTSSVTTEGVEGVEGVASSPADAGPEDSQEDGERLAEELVQLVQRCGRGALARRSMFSVLSDTPRWKAAVDIQRVWRGYCSRQLVEVYYEFFVEEVRTEGDRSEKGGNMENVEEFVNSQPATPTSSVTTEGVEGVASSPADAGPEDSQEDGERLAEELVQLVQRCGRGALARRNMFSVLSDTPRWKAAVDIQRVWRGYCSRQLVEVYYEFFVEEVRTEGDRSEKGGSA
ncbi:hypothetical protein TcYC6_0011720 [Trypanosoma cruzi]|nr:hypothetical protein TcYC6_0011720 [Trypanosoma cruzi]